MTIYEESGGSLHELERAYEEDAGSLHEVRIYEEQAGSLHLVHDPIQAETLLPEADVSNEGWDDSAGGDGDGDLWDELDESPHDGDTTHVRSTSVVGNNTETDTFRVRLEAASENHDDTQTHSVVAVLKRVETGDIPSSSNSAVLRLYNGSTLLDESGSLSIGSGSYGVASFNAGVSGLSDWSDLRIEVEVTITGDSSGTDISSTHIRCTQARLDIS
jgi:hypothetical protein